MNVSSDAMNTGILLTGFRCIDIDVDDEEVVRAICQKVQQHLPLGAIIRGRLGSVRLAWLFRATEGEPGKQVISGLHGKIEILGRGQQLVCHGLHPSGAALTWAYGRGPDTVPRDQLPAVSEDQIGRFLIECSPLLGTGAVHLEPVAGTADRMSTANDELTAGIEPPRWFECLQVDAQSEVVRACLAALDNRKDDPRERWLRVVFACAHAEQLGCPDVYEQVLAWSRHGASWTGENDFQKAWDSASPDKPGGVTIGSLIAMAREAGLDVSSWRNAAGAGLEASGHPLDTGAASGLSSTPLGTSRALRITDLPAVPAKRQWLHGTDLARGAVSLLVAPGARGKSSWLTTLGLACASGRSLLGAHVFGGPLRVLLVNAEDATNEIALRLRAAMQHCGLTDADVAALHVAGVDRLRLNLVRANGGVAGLDPAGWSTLATELDLIQPDVLIIDPLISTMGATSTNDNAAAALLMGRLVALAAERRMGIMVAHHAAKGRDPASADSAMGAASFVNLARIALAIEPLGASDAGRVGVPPWDAKFVFRVVGTKQNLSAPQDTDRWFRLTSVQMQNAEPPVYPVGDQVGVVEVFRPGASGPTFPPGLIRDALRVIDDSNPPLSPSKRAGHRWAGPSVATAIAVHRGGQASEAEGVAVLEYLKRSGLIAVEPFKLQRPGGRSDTRDGLVLSPAGQVALQTGGQMPP